MNEVIEAFQRVIPLGSKRSGRGWINFDCPSCGDQRNRGGFLETPTGGFRYRCQNGGCEYEKGAGWEPQGSFVGRARRLFHILGGDITEIPDKWLRFRQTIEFATRDEAINWWLSDESAIPLHPETELAKSFPEIGLPTGTQLLWGLDHKNALDAQTYVLDRGSFFREYPFCWSPKYPRHVILPFVHYDKVIGWTARKIDPGKEYAHIKCPNWPTDYMLNQDRVYEYPFVLVQQGAFDAIALRGLCTFGSALSKKQINLLKSCGKKICLLPDYWKTEWRSYWHTAKENGWHLAVPEWPGDDLYSPGDHIKDAGDSIKRNGLLLTLETIVNSMTQDYFTAETTYLMRSRG